MKYGAALNDRVSETPDGDERAAAIRCARVYLREARVRARNPVQRGFCFTLLAWAASQRYKAATTLLAPGPTAQMDLF